ncbi:hypothetical protein EVJ58_g6501 [Rhodofomes roseus]|uniref:Hydrophobin n=1 Tax=Rhodofomes roseus TaxID=34475 RepID=A0A4Y9Y804_9APHY|nr:hypothetical protein EVJ58_g6501 [Rhodofomes roseus]
MFAKLLCPLLALSGAVLAIPQGSSGASSCASGPVQCYNSVTPANDVDAATTTLLVLLGLVLDVECTRCAARTTNSVSWAVGLESLACGLINVGCSPVVINL